MTEARPRAMYLTGWSPLPRNFGGAFRIEALWRALSTVAEVQLVIFGDRPALEVRPELRRLGAVIYARRFETRFQRVVRLLTALARGRSMPAERYLSARRVEDLVARARAFRPDVIVVGDEYLSVLIPALRPIGARIVLDTHNAASRGLARVAATSRNPVTKLAYGALAWNTASVERRFFPLADEVWTVSADDAAFYQPLVRDPVQVVPNVVDVPPHAAPDGEPGTVVLAASYGYWPNEDAALRLIEMAPRLLQGGPLRALHLVGKSATERMRRAAAAREGVFVTGTVPEVAPYLARASVVAIPLAAGSGTKLKVLEAMALGKPVVTTPVGAEGLGLVPGVHAEIVELDRFERALGVLLRDATRRAALGAAGRALVQQRFSRATLEGTVRSLLLPHLGASREAAR